MNTNRKTNKEIHNSLMSSDIFNLTPEIQDMKASMGNTQGRLLNSKKQNLKNEDHFNLISKPPSSTKLKTGKTLVAKPSTDILNIKNKEITQKKTIMTAKKNLSKLYFGNDKDYIVKKNNYVSNYNPDNFMTVENAYERKMKNIYGNRCSSTGRWRRNILSNEEKSLQEDNKKKKTPSFIRVTKNNNIGNSKKENLKFSDIENPKITKIKMLESNIFNLSNQDTFNNTFTEEYKKRYLTLNNSPRSNKQEKKIKNYLRSSSNITRTPANINGIDWKNNNLELYTTRENALNYKDNFNKTAFQRKIQNDIISKNERNNTNSNFQSQYLNGFQLRKELINNNNATIEREKVQKLYNEINIKPSRQKKLADEFSSNQSAQFIENTLKKRSKNRSVDDIKNISNSNYEVKNVNLYDEKIITKTLLDNGIDIYDIKNYSKNNIFGNENHDLQFKIRQNLNDNNFKHHLVTAKLALKNKTGKDLIHISERNPGKKNAVYYENNINKIDNKLNARNKFRRLSNNNSNDDSKSSISSSNRHDFSNTFNSINHKYKNPIYESIQKSK